MEGTTQVIDHLEVERPSVPAGAYAASHRPWIVEAERHEDRRLLRQRGQPPSSYGSARQCREAAGVRHEELPGVKTSPKVVSQVDSPVDSVGFADVRRSARVSTDGFRRVGLRRLVGAHAGRDCGLSGTPPRSGSWTVDNRHVGRPVEAFRRGEPASGPRREGLRWWRHTSYEETSLAASDALRRRNHVTCRHPRDDRTSHAATLRDPGGQPEPSGQERAEPDFQSATERFQSP